MNKRNRKYLTLLMAILTIGCMAMTLFATTGGKRVRVYLTDGIKYTLDKKEILPKTTTIILKDKAYAPVEELAKALGYNVEVKGDVITITSGKPMPPTPPITKPTPPPITKPTPPPVTKPEGTATLPKAEIVAINFADKTVSVLPAGKPNQVSNLIELKLSDKTVITDGKTKKIYSINDLTTGMPVSVVHSTAMTKSIPPQTAAYTITILK
ncbi:MAG: hypothetical protein ACRCTE_07775 [Cellulosilyticaceae bacterium]